MKCYNLGNHWHWLRNYLNVVQAKQKTSAGRMHPLAANRLPIRPFLTSGPFVRTVLSAWNAFVPTLHPP